MNIEDIKNETKRQRILNEFVNQHIGENQTMLIDELLKNEIVHYEDIVNLYDDDEEPEEIFEWWQADEWLLNKLEAKGEPVLRSDYGNWWGRTCTGQAIHMDAIIEEIYKESQI